MRRGRLQEGRGGVNDPRNGGSRHENGRDAENHGQEALTVLRSGPARALRGHVPPLLVRLWSRVLVLGALRTPRTTTSATALPPAVLGLPPRLRRAQQPANGIADFLLNEIPDHHHQTLRSRHRLSFRWVALRSCIWWHSRRLWSAEHGEVSG